jgi:hypothetical protein
VQWKRFEVNFYFVYTKWLWKAVNNIIHQLIIYNLHFIEVIILMCKCPITLADYLFAERNASKVDP